ncbi:hypothetical protein ACLB2K_045279 [Fragaria x ananassa]
MNPSTEGWITVAKKAPAQNSSQRPNQPYFQNRAKPANKCYVVFEGFKTGIFHNWAECAASISRYRGALWQGFPNVDIAALEYQKYIAAKVRCQVQQTQDNLSQSSEIRDFYNPGLPGDVYNTINAVWKSHIAGIKKEFRVQLTQLSTQISNLAAQLDDEKVKTYKFKHISLQVLKQINWSEDFTLEKITSFLQLSELLEDISDPTFEQIKRICLFEKSKNHLPYHLFTDIYVKIHNHGQVIQDMFLEHSESMNVKDDGIPKLSFIINHDEWNLAAIEWGITNQVIFQSLDYATIKDFPQFIKTMVYHVAKSYRLSKYLTFSIASTIGWREREKFFQPYQIWWLTETEDHQVNQAMVPPETVNRLISNLNLEQYAIQSGAHLKDVAEDIRKSNLLKLTDGRRVFATHMASSYQPTPEQQKQADDLLSDMATDISQLDLPFMVGQEIEEMSNLPLLDSNSNQSMGLDDVGYQNLDNAMEA